MFVAAIFVPPAFADHPPRVSEHRIRTAAATAAVEDVFNRFGLFGVWALDCAKHPAPDNPHVRITMPSPGLVFEEHDLGPSYTVNRYSVLAAEAVAPTRVSVRVIFQPGAAGEERQTLVFELQGGTRRTMFNQADGGPVRVKDGIALARGSKTPTLKKCN
jgi:hypothetical protein